MHQRRGRSDLNMAQGTTIIGFVFSIVAFVFIWAIFLAKYLRDIGNMLIQDSGATGLLAFTYGNLNLIVLIGLILFILMGVYQAR